MAKLHFIGIGGAGLSAIATVLLQQGYQVSGSDKQASPTTERLRQLGATIFVGHRPQNLGDGLAGVIISAAIGPDNVELVAAQQRGLPIYKRAQWLGQMMANHVGIAIAGTHGKTTTTAMIAYLLHNLGQQPTYIVGGFIPQLGSNAAAGQGPAFVIEADEYDYMFLGLRPHLAVITNVEWDHPDMFPTPQTFTQAFVDFAQRVPANGLIIGCGDAPGVHEVLAQVTAPRVTYGLSQQNQWRAVDLALNQQGGYNFTVVGPDVAGVPVSLALAGQHNVQNALAALIVAQQQGLDVQSAADTLGQFTGTARRFELKGEVNGIIIVDDYAHHPTEVKATLAAARGRFPQHTIWAMFQPHTFSRTLALQHDFATAFAEADQVIVVDIFASRERDEGLINSRDLVSQMAQGQMAQPNVRYLGPLTAAADYLTQHLTAPAVLLTLGAGDGYLVGEWVLERLGHLGVNITRDTPPSTSSGGGYSVS